MSHSGGWCPEVRSGEACPSSTSTHQLWGSPRCLVGFGQPEGSIGVTVAAARTGRPGGCHAPAAEEKQRGGGLGGLTGHCPPTAANSARVPGWGASQGRRTHRGHLRAVSWGSGQSPEGPSNPKLGPVGMWPGRGGGRSGFWKLGALRRRGLWQVRAAGSLWFHAWKRTLREQGSVRRSPGGSGKSVRGSPPAGGQVSGPEARLTLWAPTTHRCDTRSGIKCTRRASRNLPAARSRLTKTPSTPFLQVTQTSELAMATECLWEHRRCRPCAGGGS